MASETVPATKSRSWWSKIPWRLVPFAIGYVSPIVSFGLYVVYSNGTGSPSRLQFALMAVPLLVVILLSLEMITPDGNGR